MENLVSEKELAEKLDLSRSTLVRLRKKGLPYHKVGYSVRYNLKEVQDWIDKNPK